VINGKKITMKDSFRAYANFSEAAEDYAKFLTTQPRYHPAFIHSKDPLKFADALQLADMQPIHPMPKSLSQLLQLIIWMNMTNDFY
jgi:hypothetical protein